MNIEQAKKQAELVYEANVHLGEEEAQRLYTETLENLLADAADARQRQTTDYSAWAEYVDPQGIVSEDQFRKMSIKEKTALIETVFGADATYADADASAR